MATRSGVGRLRGLRPSARLEAPLLADLFFSRPWLTGPGHAD